MLKDDLKRISADTENERLFYNGFRLNNTVPFKVVSTTGHITQLANYQNSLIELIQGFSLYANEYGVTDDTDPVFDGLEILKMFMLNSEQLNELHNSRKARTEKEEKRRKKRLNKKVKQLEKSNKKREIEIKENLKRLVNQKN